MDKHKHEEKLKKLTAQAASKENKLEMTQVLDAFAGELVTPEEMEDIYSRLEKKKIQILAEESGESGRFRRRGGLSGGRHRR